MLAQMLLYFLTTKAYSELAVRSSRELTTDLYFGVIKNDLMPIK
jgi:hypothetical protein